MKKSVISLSLACAAVGSYAQSSVEVFGVADVGLAHLSSSTGSGTGASTGGANISRLGFRGNEDLGGGLKAGYWLEAGLDINSGAGKTSGALSFNRRSTVSVSGNFGEVRLGRDDSASFLSTLIFDPFLTNGVGGTMSFTMLGAPGTANAIGGAPIQISNAVSYFLPPDLGGFYGQAQVAFGGQPSTAANSKQGNYEGLRAGYRQGALNVAFATGKLMGDIAANDLTAKNIGVSYDFGMVKPMFIWATEEKSFIKITAMQIGLTAPLGAGELRASYGRYDTANSSADWNKLAVGYGYNFSKRTQVYGSYAQISNGAAAKKVVTVQGGMTSAANALGASATGLEVGLRHFF